MDPFQPVHAADDKQLEDVCMVSRILSPIFDENSVDVPVPANSTFNNSLPALFETVQSVDNSNIATNEDQFVPLPSVSDVDNTREEVKVFDGTGKDITLKKRELTRHQLNKRGNVSPSKVRGPRCLKYLESSGARSKSRLNHIEGFCKKMRDLKSATGDNSFLIIYTNTKDKTIKKFTTDRCLLGLSDNSLVDFQTETPSNDQLVAFSPSKYRTANNWRCNACGLCFGEEKDIDFESSWLNCESEGCDVWQHVKCLGIVSVAIAKNQAFRWRCQRHRENPQTTILTTKKNNEEKTKEKTKKTKKEENITKKKPQFKSKRKSSKKKM